eukprot:PhM_4_TR14809/c0_g1_i1/m.12994
MSFHYILFITNVMSNFTVLPTVRLLFRRRWWFESFVVLAGMVTSTLYHASQAAPDVPLFLSELQWHRLDNICGLCCFAVFFLYLCDLRAVHQAPLRNSLKFVCVGTAMLAQEKDPWNINYTLFPFLLYAIISVLVVLVLRLSRPQYDGRNLRNGFGLLGVAFLFFIRGLDDATDPGRVYHGTWHMLAGCSSYYLWNIVVLKENREDYRQEQGSAVVGGVSSMV